MKIGGGMLINMNKEIVQLSKEFVRGHYLSTGHHDDLYKAREQGTEEPPIPALPQEIIDKTAETCMLICTQD